ncbi:zf-TFIIB domain-containing protein [Lentzea sp. NPDC058436]|uniref:TFIIB-type zinc ribbon-containing protein n=1 Tax=Lentzea sp. NPDC058436 TaxID=3346499 RepID=UPI0036500260
MDARLPSGYRNSRTTGAFASRSPYHRRMICPKCQHAMRTYDQHGIHLEQCDNCRGIYLDAGELQQILLADRARQQSAQFHQSPPPLAAPPPYQPAPAQAPHHPAPPSHNRKNDDWDDDDDDFFGSDKNSRGKKKKKKDSWAFLDDIFG